MDGDVKSFIIFPKFIRNRGNTLTENVIFIMLNLVFFTILILFLLKSSNGSGLLEQAYAKQIALLIDASKPGMEFFIDISRGVETDEEWFKKNSAKSVTIDGNVVTVKLTGGEGYSYSFFNDVKPSVDVWPEGKVYIIIK